MNRSYALATGTLSVALLLTLGAARSASAADEKDRLITLEEGHIKLKAPAGWERKVPRFRIVEHEFATPAAEGDKDQGRITIMGAGGDVEANIGRWVGSFTLPEGAKPTQKKMEVAGQMVHYLDVAGTYKDMPAGPFAGGKPILRENYRMLGVIIVTKDFGSYFVKFYGPAATVAAQEKAFLELVNSLEVK